MATSTELFNEICDLFDEFKTHADGFFSGKSTYGPKSRKDTMKIQALFKEYRATTVQEGKDNS